jgi:hypothetical protein
MKKSDIHPLFRWLDIRWLDISANVALFLSVMALVAIHVLPELVAKAPHPLLDCRAAAQPSPAREDTCEPGTLVPCEAHPLRDTPGEAYYCWGIPPRAQLLRVGGQYE